MNVDDPRAILALWCTQRGLPPPVYVASRVAGGGVQVVGSITLDGGRYLRACHHASRESEAEICSYKCKAWWDRSRSPPAPLVERS